MEPGKSTRARLENVVHPGVQFRESPCNVASTLGDVLDAQEEPGSAPMLDPGSDPATVRCGSSSGLPLLVGARSLLPPGGDVVKFLFPFDTSNSVNIKLDNYTSLDYEVAVSGATKKSGKLDLFFDNSVSDKLNFVVVKSITENIGSIELNDELVIDGANFQSVIPETFEYYFTKNTNMQPIGISFTGADTNAVKYSLQITRFIESTSNCKLTIYLDKYLSEYTSLYIFYSEIFIFLHIHFAHFQ